MVELDLPPETRLLLVRHGQSTWNLEGRVQGQSDAPLSDLGRRQAELLAARLATSGAAAIYSSDLARALQTAAPVAEHLALSVDAHPGFREVHFGRWEGLTREEIGRLYPEEGLAYLQDPIRNRPQGGERLEALQARAVAAVEPVLERHAGETVILVAHGGSIRALLLAFLRLPIEYHFRFVTDNGGITCVDRGDHAPRLLYLNETGHLRNGLL